LESSTVDVNDSIADSSFVGVGDAAAVNANLMTGEELTESSEKEPDLPRIYGAQQRNLIVDARPTVNAIAMQAIGLGSEKMDYYPNAEKAYLGIDNIHVMRKSLNAVVEALKDYDYMSYAPPQKALMNSGWLKHIDNILKGTALIARTVGVMHSHVLIHCSDGWDRTSQLSALSQICLDPYYRTMEGFMVLVEKDWLSFGHMFRHRSGFLGSDKWFEIENERVERNPDGSGGGNPFENALRGARGLFNRQNNSNEALSQPGEPDAAELASGKTASTSSDPTSRPDPTRIGAAEEQRTTKVNELSPVFHQFLDATYQLTYQYPTRFEFNERFLRRLLYHLYSCQYGTFLFDNERERIEARAAQRTRSVWDYFLCRKPEFLNPNYDPEVDDSIRGKERMIFPKTGLNNVRWWAEVFGRADADMNMNPTVAQASRTSTSHLGVVDTPPNGGSTPARSASPSSSSFEQVITGRESADRATGAGTTVHPPPNLLPAAAEWSQSLGSNINQGLTAGIASLSIKSTNRNVSPGPSTKTVTATEMETRSDSPRSSTHANGRSVREEMEVEMQ
jgi:hypothetical protein